MATELNIKLLVESMLKDKGLVDAKTQIDNLGKQVERLQGQLDKSKESGSAFGKTLMQFVGLGSLTAFIKSSVVDFAELDRAFNATGYSMQGLGLDASKELPRVREFLQSIQDGGGALVRETVPSFQKFIGITKDTGAALAAVKLATDISESGMVDVGTAAQGLAAILQGKAKSAANSFGLELNKTNGEQKTAVELLDEAIAKYGGLADSMGDAQDEMDRLSGTWEGLSRTVGEGFAPGLTVVNGILFHGIGLIKDYGTIWGAFLDMAIAGTSDFARVLADAFNLKKLFTAPKEYLATLTETWNRATRNVAAEWNGMFDQIVENHTRAAAKQEDVTAGLKKLREQAARAAAKDEAEEAKKAAAQRQEFEERATLAALQSQVAAAREGSDERLRLELQLLERKRAAELAKAREIGASVAQINASYDAQRLAKIAEFERKRAEETQAAEDELRKAELDAAKEGTQERLDLELSMLDRKHREAIAKVAGNKAAEFALETAYQINRLALIKTYDEKRYDAELKSYQESIAAEEELEEQLAQRRVELAEMGRGGNKFDERDSLNEARRKREQAGIERQLHDELKAAGKNDDERARAYQRYVDRKRAADVKYGRESIKLENDKKAAQKEAYSDIADAAIGFASAAFGNNKAVAVAEATMHGANAVMSVWDKWAWNPAVCAVLEALTIATTVAQIAKITSSDAGGGSGFDDPVNDRVANLGGRKWARDLVDQIGGGFRSEMGRLSPFSAVAPSQSSTTYSRGGDTYHFHGLLVDDRSLRKAGRLIERGQRLDAARRLR